MACGRRDRRRAQDAWVLARSVDRALLSACLFLIGAMAVAQCLLLAPSARKALSLVEREEGLPVLEELWGLSWLGLHRGVVMLRVIGSSGAPQATVLVNGKRRTTVTGTQRVVLPVRDLDFVSAKGAWLVVTGTSRNVVSPRPGQVVTEAGFRIRIAHKKEETGQ